MHDTYETHAFARQGADETLVFSGITNGASNGVHAGAQCRFRDDPPIPDGGDQVVLADNPVAVLDQIFEEIEDLRGNGDLLRPATQLAPVRVKGKVSEAETKSPLRTGTLAHQPVKK